MSEAIPLEAFFGDGYEPNRATATDFPQLLRDADIIIGVDVMSKNEFVVFGRRLLEEIAGGQQGKFCKILRIAIDHETEELEKLCALVTVTKGYNDYGSFRK
jgi:hypothetical protein